MDEAIVATDLRKRYGKTEALDGLSLAVAPGTISDSWARTGPASRRR
jgi:ABC-type multidrug transport system ATPase subunit